jgi:hypothetical protein
VTNAPSQARAYMPWCVDSWLRVARPGCEDFVFVSDLREARMRWDSLGPNQVLVATAPRRRPGQRSHLARELTELSGATVERFLAFPGTGGSRVLVGAAPLAAIPRALDLLPAGRRRWRFVRAILRPCTRIGLGNWLGLEELVVAHRQAAATTHITAALGVPGLFRKTVVREGDAQGRALRFLKVGDAEASRSSIQREAEALTGLQERRFALAPNLLDRGEHGQVAWLAQGPIEGRRSGDDLGPLHAKFLEALAQSHPSVLPLARIESVQSTIETLNDLEGRVDDSWWNAMDDLARGLRRAIGSQSILCTLAHGDFTPWNLIERDGHLVAIDWEFSEVIAPAGRDLCHFHMQTGILVRHVPGGKLLVELLDLLHGPFQSTSCLDAEITVGLALLHQAVHDERINAIEPPPCIQVGWLRDARLEMARILVLSLADATPARMEAAA